jgi:phosphoribosylaminoimidazole-succinocarboxamide synthase
MAEPVFETHLENLNFLKRGKVRDLYELEDYLLMVATDRISAFDVVMPTPIPDKGKILTRMSLFWFEQIKPLVGNHLVTADVGEYPAVCRSHATALRDRSMLVRKAQPLPIECVVRGYISGSGWKSYQKDRTVCGIKLPDGLQESDRLPEPIFTPSTKEESGHDINIDFAETVRRIGSETAEKVRDLSLEVYRRGAAMAEEKGIIIADTKFEFGRLDDELILIDEILTPDSSRFWPMDSYSPGGGQKSFDKQYLRDYLLSLDWDKTPPAPALPDSVVTNTRQKYMEALNRLTGQPHDF